MRWILPLLAILGAALPANSQPVFPLPSPTRPTVFPLQRPHVLWGQVVGWGDNTEGKANATWLNDLTDFVQVSAGYNHSIALRADGTVRAWGVNSGGRSTVPAGLTDVVQVCAGFFHSVALKSDGTVVVWGGNEWGQLNVPAGLTNVVQIDAGGVHTIALKSDGTVIAWGRNLEGQTTIPSGLTNVVRVSAGELHNLALKADGTVTAWGANSSANFGQAFVPQGLSNVVAVAAGGYHSVALKKDGTVATWGNDEYGQTSSPALRSDIVQVDCSQWETGLLTAAGQALTWGRFLGSVLSPTDLSNVVQIAVGDSHVLAVISDPNTLARVTTRSPVDPATFANWSALGRPWMVDKLNSIDGIDSAKAETTDGQSTYREYTLTGPAVIDFWWKVSSEQGYDTFSYAVNGVNQQTISGEVDWTYRTLTLPEGTHAIRWTYSKDESGAVGQDAGWLDDFAAYPATATLQVRDGSTTLTDNAQVSFGSGGGQNALTKTLTFQNSGYVPLEVGLSLPSDSPFTFADGGREYLLLLGREDSSNVALLMPVSSAGQKTATLTISAPESTSPPPSIQLTGTVLGGDIRVAQGGNQIASGQPSPVDLGIAPREMEFTITNNGNVADLTISQLSATGNFQITQQPAATVAVGGSTTFRVLATDSQQGVQFGSISIASNDENTPVFTIPVTSKALLGLGVRATTNSAATGGQGGGVGWDFATTTLPSGSTGSASRTGSTPDGGQSYLEATFAEAGLLSWTWKVSTQENFDWLLCEVNGQEAAGISTKNGVWQTQVVQVPAGANVRWVYRKDASGNIGEDAGYLADVEFRSLAANQSFGQWAQTHGIYDPQQRLPESGLKAIFAWLGGFDPAVGTSSLDLHHDIVLQPDGMFLSLLLYRFSISKTADGTQQILYSSDMTSWTTRRISQRIVSEDADRVVIEATAPSGTKGFFKVGSAGDTALPAMADVQGGELPQSSIFAGANVAAFQIGRTEVTLDLWRAVRDWGAVNGYSELAGLGAGSAGNHPVRQVNWYDALKWCNARSEKDGLKPVYQVNGGIYRRGQIKPTVDGLANGYRLPTDAEWEWAARGGVRSRGYAFSGSDDPDAVAWSWDNSSGALVDLDRGRGTWPVGQKAPNELGLYDMSGNIYEWCIRFYAPNNQNNATVRGASWVNERYLGRVDSYYSYGTPYERASFLGFRVARNAED